MNFTFLAPYAPQLRSILRIMAALTFFTHGTQKLLGWPLAGPPTLSPMIMTAGVLELVGGALLAIGLFSRPVAFILSGLMACAYFIGHAMSASGFVFFPIMNRGEAALLFCFIFLYIACAGGGPIGVDAMRGKR